MMRLPHHSHSKAAHQSPPLTTATMLPRVAVASINAVSSVVAINSRGACCSAALVVCVCHCDAEGHKSDCEYRDCDQLLLSFVNLVHLCNNIGMRMVNGQLKQS